MTDPHRLHAVERAISTIIEQFERFPDLFHRESDLHSGFCRILQSAPLLAEVYLTRDGRHTGLVHREYPAFFSCDAPAGLGSSGGRFDVAVLAPGFVRGHCLEVVANLEGRAAESWRDRDPQDRPVPLLAAIHLKLLSSFEPLVLGKIEADFYELVRSENDVQRLYMALFCNHWDLDEQIRRAMPVFEYWTARHTQVSLVVVQSYYDRVGHVFGGRYFNIWSHTAPLPPLELLPQPSLHGTAWAWR